MSRRERWALVGVVGLAVLLRAGWVGVALLDPYDGEYYDSTFYHITASQLVAGNGYARMDGAPTAVWPPGYPVLLAGVYALTGTSVLAGKLANALFGALATLAVFGLGRRLFGTRAGLWGALLYAACPDDILYANFILSEAAFAAVFTGLLWLFVALQQRRPPAGPWAWIGLGFATGLATLTRGVALAWLAVPTLVWLVQGRAWRPAWPRAALALLGLACAIAPWTARNAVQMGAPILVASSSGRTLAHAHGPFESAEGSLEGFVWRQQLTRQHAHLPFPEQEVAVMRAFTQRSLEFMWSHPGQELAWIPQRLLHLYGSGHRGIDIGRPKLPDGSRKPVFGARGRAALAWTADLLFWGLLALGLLGVRTCWRHPDRTALVLPFTLLYVTALHTVLFPADPRYHAPLLPVLAVSAGAWLASLRRDPRAARPS